jgi:hypothetical protein
LIENQIDLRLLDISGKLIAKKSYFNQNEFEYIVEGAAGIYYLEIETSTFKSKCIKVMKF